jgi:hypothetical protein
LITGKGQDTISKRRCFITTNSSGQKRRTPTTKGWDLRIKWRKGLET